MDEILYHQKGLTETNTMVTSIFEFEKLKEGQKIKLPRFSNYTREIGLVSQNFTKGTVGFLHALRNKVHSCQMSFYLRMGNGLDY